MENLDKCKPPPNFGGIHPSPNLVHVNDLDAKMVYIKVRVSNILL